MDIETFAKFKNESLHQLGELLTDCENVIRRAHPAVSVNGSQGEEDAELAKLLEGTEGCYVDVGAAEPVECSNTWQFYKRGWRGLLVEPLPQFWNALLRHRPGDCLYPVAALDRAGFSRMRVSGTVSSLRPDWAIDTQTEFLVETERLSSMLEKFPAIRDNCRLLSLDVEGSEKQVLDGIDWATFKPTVIIVEYITYDPEKLGAETTAQWEPQILEAGYRFHLQTALNRIYVRNA